MTDLIAREDVADRINAAIAGAGRVFLVALTIAIVLTGAVLVERERIATYLTRQASVDAVLSKLAPVVRQTALVEQALASYLIAAYGGYADQAHVLRQLLKDRRDAGRLMTGLRFALPVSHEIESEQRSALRRTAERYRRLLNFNLPEGMIQEEHEPTLLLADIGAGSFRAVERLYDLPLDDLARLAYVASLRPDLLGGVAAITAAERRTGLDVKHFTELQDSVARADAESRIAVSGDTRLMAATLYEQRARIRQDPAAYGLHDGAAPLTVSTLRTTYEEALSYQAPPDTQAWRREARIDPLGVGFKLSLGSAALLAPGVIAGLLLLAAVNFWRAGRLARRNSATNKVVIALPLVVEPEARPGDAPLGWLVQVIVLIAPLALSVYFALTLKTGLAALPAVALATLALCFAAHAFGRAVRETEP